MFISEEYLVSEESDLLAEQPRAILCNAKRYKYRVKCIPNRKTIRYSWQSTSFDKIKRTRDKDANKNEKNTEFTSLPNISVAPTLLQM